MPTPCPGPCNNAWRKAETRLATDGTPHHIPATWGQPVQCSGCVDSTRAKLAQLPTLLTSVRDEPLEGTATTLTGTIGRNGLNTAWPGQAARILIDRIVGEMAVLKVDILARQRLVPDDTEPGPGTVAEEDRYIAGIINVLNAHWDWAMQKHPAAYEEYDLASGNPGSQVTGWWRSATYFIKDHGQPPVERLAPCPKCRGPWLAESRDLRLVGDRPYIECRDDDCGNIMTGAEYDRYVKELTGAIVAAA